MLLRPISRLYHTLIRKYDRKQHFKPIILITGCGSGLGLAIAELLSKYDRYRVVITAREKSISLLKEKFKESDRIMIRELDITSDYSRLKLIEDIKTLWGGVNILINNAGISYRSVIEHMTTEDEITQMSTNYLGPMALIRAVLPNMRELGRGKIINISSVSGMLSMPTMASYSASKHALEGACESLWYEARPFGIDVSLIQPGFIHSNSFKNVYLTTAARAAIENEELVYSDFYRNMTPFVENLMKQSRSSPSDIAKQVLWVIQKESPPLWVAATFDAYMFYYIRRFLPRRLLLPVLFFFLPKSSSWGQKHTRKRANW